MPNKKGPPKNWQEVRDEQRAMNAAIAERRREEDRMVEAERKKESEKWIAAAEKAREDSILADRAEREKQSSLMQAAEAYRLELIQATDERDYQLQRQAELNAMQLKSRQLGTASSPWFLKPRLSEVRTGADPYRGRTIDAADLAEQFGQFLRAVSPFGVCREFFELCQQAAQAQQDYERGERGIRWDAQQAEGYAIESEIQRRLEERMRMLDDVEPGRGITLQAPLIYGTGNNPWTWQEPTLAPPEELSVASACSRKFFLVPE